MRVRPAAVAGLFYPSDPERLAAAVGDAVDVPVPADEPPPKAVIVPHAGYVYSGPTAGVAYARVRRLHRRIERVVLLGPAHRAWVDGLAVSSVRHAARHRARRRCAPTARPRAAWRHDRRSRARRRAFARGQLPFLQSVLGAFTLLPLAVGDASPGEVAAVLDRVWGGPETLVVVSSDLSHCHDYATARARDRRTAAAIVAADAAAIADDDA